MSDYPILNSTDLGGKSVDVPCRRYEVDNTPLFSSIVASGKELLSKPMKLRLFANGGEQIFEKSEVFDVRNDDGSVTLLTSTQSELFLVNTEIKIEDDGCCFIRVCLATKGHTVPQVFGIEPKPTDPRVLDSFYIEIPLKKEFSGLYQTYPWKTPHGDFDQAIPADLRGGGIVPKGGMHVGFIPQIYLCNETAGCGVFFESDENWINEDPERVIEVIENNDERVLRIRLLDAEPYHWREFSNNAEHNVNLSPMDFNFGFIATPVRELPANMFPEHSFHIDCFKKIAENYEDYFSGPVVEGSDEIGFDRLERLGVNVLYLHEKWNDIQNSSVLTEKSRARLKYIVSECHKRGIKVIPYFGYEISTLSPYFGKYAKELTPEPFNVGKISMWNRVPPQRAVYICYNNDEYRELFIEGVKKIIEEFELDGIYIDSALTARSCMNHLHGCSYVDFNGKRHPTNSFMAVRTLLKPIYEFIRSRNGIMNLHGFGTMSLSAISCATSLWEGENFQSLLMRGDMEVMPEGLMRCQFTGRNLGVPVMSLCYSNPPKWTYREAISMSLLHGSMPKPVDIGEPLELTSKVWNIYDNFNIGDSTFHPYYEQNDIAAGDERVKVSYYKADGKMLVVVASTARSVDTDITLDLSSFGAKEIKDTLEESVVEGSVFTKHLNGFDLSLLWVTT